MKLRDWQIDARSFLIGASQTPELDTQILLMHVLGKAKSWVFSHPDHELGQGNIALLNGLIERAKQGEPIPYLIGHWEFFNLDLLVNQDVLIPRPETELMVEPTLAWLKNRPDSNRMLDMGTGSGCIAVALAVNLPRIQIVAADISVKALVLAQKNMEKYDLQKRITLIQSNLFDGLDGRYDVICANLPYIPTAELESLPVAKYEPRAALDGGEKGLTLISAFLEKAGAYINNPGLILCEIGSGQENAIIKIARQNLPNSIIRVHPDLQGIARIVSFET